MQKCGQITEHKAQSICGLDICCHECDHKCEKACKNDKESCEYLRADNECNDTRIMPDNDKFLNKNIDFLKQIKEFQTKLDKMKDQEEVLRKKLKEAMNEFNITEFENDFIKISMQKPYIRNSIDTKRLKAEKPEIANEYMKETEVAGRLIITPKIDV